MKKAILQMLTAVLVLGLFFGAANAAPVIIAPAGNSTPVMETVGQIATFELQTNESTDIDWEVDGTAETKNTSYYNNTSILTHTIESDEYEIEATVRSTGESRTWDVAGTETTPEENATETEGNFTETPPEGPVTVIPGKAQTFKVNATDDQKMDVEWFVDGESKQDDPGVTSSSYEFEESDKDQYTISAVITDPNGVYDSATKTWTVNVQSASHSSGNRIWDESQNMSKTYTWNAQSYSGFYYDLDSGVSSEEMTITDIGRNIDSGNIEYVTRPTETKFEYDKWGSYQVIGFMAEKYFAGYSEGNSTVIGDDVSLISNGILAKVLTDSDDRKSANAGQSLPLEEGYSLSVKEVDVNGNSVWVQLEKDGKVVEDSFVSSNQDYIYKKDIGDATDMPVIIVHFGTVFSGTETSAVFIQGIFQISDDYVEIKNGDTFEKMEVKSIGSDEIKMENSDDIGLDKGDTVDLMGKIKIQVADNNELRFAPILDTSEAGIYELRGTVYDEGIDDTLPVSWTPFNFEGFYYNIDEGIGTEELTVEELDGKSIPSDKLVYKSTPQPVEFEHNNWGNFTVVGFMADKYFAGYPDGAVNGEVDRVSLLSNDILSKVLTDSDDKVSMYSGSAFTLEDGYSLSIKEVDVNGNSVWVQLEKDGTVVEDAFVSSNKDYVYKTDIGKAEDIPLIIVHFGTVFSGTETSAVFIQGIFQISSDYTEISNKESFGKMEVSSVSEDGITMKNNDDIGLDGGDTTEIMGNVSFKTADANTPRFYPFVEVNTDNENSSGLNVNLPAEIIQGETFNIQVTAQQKAVEGASVEINATNAGKTDANGTLAYTAENTGTLKLTVEKEGYPTVSKSINVIPPKEKMTVSILPEMVYVGNNITIEAIKSIGGDPIEGANVSIDGKVFDKTGSDGKMTYMADKNGTLRVGVAKEGFQNQSIDVNVRNFEAIYKFSNLVIDPIEVSAGKNTTISVNVNNTGNAAGNNSVELLVNRNVTDSKAVPLDVGKNTTVTFEHGEEVPGSYKVEVGGETATYNVTEKSSLIWYVLGAFILLIIGGAAYYFTKGGGDVAEVQKKIQELIDSVKPKK